MGELILVGTPIGNLGDLSPRAVEALNKADFIAAEDTRVSGKLLSHLGIKKPMMSYFEHNKAARGEQILEKLQQGETVALMTDAGMPAISDQGEDLVALCVANGIPVRVCPGPSAVVSALAMSGLPTQRFCFEGFLTVNKAGRREHLQSLKNEHRTMIFYEAPHKLVATLADLYAAFGDRRITLCREMTKLHEENIYTSLASVQERFRTEEPRGEFVLVIEGAPEEKEAPDAFAEAMDEARRLMANGSSVKDAARTAATAHGVAKNAVYTALLKE